MKTTAATAAPVPGLAVLLLLGGRSTRMGQSKHLLPHPRSGKPLYQHHIETLLGLAEEGTFPGGIFVSGRREQITDLSLPEGVQAVSDDPETNGDIGPAAGILQAAAAKPDATWLILAVDLPFISRDSIIHLLNAHSTDSPVSLYLHSDDGNPEPLFSIWTPTALAQLRSNCRAGKSGPCRAAKDVWGGKIGPGKGGVAVPTEDWITDADTPDEWRAVHRRLTASESVPCGEKCDASKQTENPGGGPRRAFSRTTYKSLPFEAAIAIAHSLPACEARKRRPSSGDAAYPMRLQRPDEDDTSSLLAGVGQITEQDIHAVLPHPLADNSAMDGFAVNAKRLSQASSDSPVFLPILGRILAGEAPPPTGSPTQDGCWEVMTGAILPSETFDAVIKVEDVLPSDSTSDSLGRRLVGFAAPAKSGQHIRRQGEQFRAGDLLLRAGEAISPEHVMLLAAAGITSVRTSTTARSRREIERRVAILTTGKEVVPFGDFAGGTRIETGQVIDCITPFLQATLLSRGCEPVLLASAGDSVTALRASLDSALGSSSFDLIITVAGVSLGSADHTPAVLASLGLDELFHGVAIRPGGPVMLSVHRASNTPVLSLPGNPMASAVCMQSFGAAILDGPSPHAGGEGWSELNLGSLSSEREEQESASWQDWLERLKPGMSTFAALPVSDQGVPTPRGVFSAGRRTGPCALGSLIGAGAWVRADRAASKGGKDKVFWRPF